jgi:hypothetical protein
VLKVVASSLCVFQRPLSGGGGRHIEDDFGPLRLTRDLVMLGI